MALFRMKSKYRKRGGEISYYGTTTDLSYACKNLAATSIGNYALFGGGMSSSAAYRNILIYNDSLVQISSLNLTIGRAILAATSIGNYALFGGGYNTTYDRDYNYVDAVSSSLTMTSTTLATARNALAATSIGNYALFGGGYMSYNVEDYVDVYDTSLTRVGNGLTLIEPSACLAATSVGNYAIFAGGNNNYNITFFDNSLTRLTYSASLELYNKRIDLAATSVGNYAIFAGGRPSSSYDCYKTVDIYSNSLTKVYGTNYSHLLYKKCCLAATSVGNYAIFAGGRFDGYILPDNEYIGKSIDVYDTSLTKSNSIELSIGRYNLAATFIGNYALFGGGEANYQSSYERYYKTVDVFQVS